MKQIAKSACQVLRANPVLLFQYDTNKDQLVPPPIYSGTLFEEAGYAKTFVFSGDTFAEMVIANRESLYFEQQDEIDNHPFMHGGHEEDLEGRPKTRFHKREHIKSLAALVLEAEDETVGLMFVNYRSHQSFSEPVKKLMKTFASYAAIAIKNSRLIEKLRRNEAFQRHIVERIPDPVLVTRNKKVNDKLVWRIDVANRAAHELFGYDFHSREFEGKDARIWLGDELERLTSALQEGNGEVSDFEINLPHKDDHRIPVLISTSVLETD
ncbi:PAS domain-containing protein, partial [candidate division KSB1 bacterium]|nr:PAS domain-containing protein [candidate division KSB1 bacterium]NIS25300.1 PAS domain-containing protein [candidate division KSB1 bacterium]NIU26021.1 PAS domain-containing protein [candidate division KSB1 bacterium]NIU89154.1 PAS domain-containing protein [candidate division KSB1 bacterium]NIV91210.1 PAS domain-containing protein [candidate division KSB1 bacterium]